jgi:Protein of unknown function (DUF2844)
MRFSHFMVYSLLLAGAISAPALASLGGSAASVETDRTAFRGTDKVSAMGSYTVHEISAAGGLTIHEYVSPDGKVFAVSWRGPRVPDLRTMLGSSFDEFAQARAALGVHRDHRHLSIQTQQLVVHSSGHLRLFSGQAWLPAALPTDFSVNAIN